MDDKPEGFDGNTDALLAAKAQAKQQLQTAYQLSVRVSAACIVDHVAYTAKSPHLLAGRNAALLLIQRHKWA